VNGLELDKSLAARLRDLKSQVWFESAWGETPHTSFCRSCLFEVGAAAFFLRLRLFVLPCAYYSPLFYSLLKFSRVFFLIL
jgi:hypothetical protein